MKKQTFELIGGVAAPRGAAICRFKLPLPAAALILAAWGAQGLTAGPPPSGTQSVDVINTPTVNVGTLPAVTLSGTPTVNVGNTPTVTLGGTPTVNLGASSTVKVGNTLASPVPGVDTEKLARIPYQSLVSGFSGAPNCTVNATSCQKDFGAAPAGYRLVIESFSADVVVAAGGSQPVLAYLTEDTQSANPPTNLGKWSVVAPLGPTLPNGQIEGAASLKVVAYFDPTDGYPAVVLESTSAIVAFMATASGYLENCKITGCPAIAH